MTLTDKQVRQFDRQNKVNKDIALAAKVKALQAGAGQDLEQGKIIRGGSGDVSEEYVASGDAKILIGDGTDINSVSVSGDVSIDNAGAVTIAANAVEPSMLQAGLIYGVSVDDAKTTSVEENVAGLSSAITLANELKADMNSHAADILEHTTAIDDVNFPIADADASDLASLITLVTSELTAYDAHDADAEAGTPSYHAATEASDHSLASAVAPTTLAECITRLNDLKAKYNAHDADSTAHGVGSNYQIAAADAANGAAILVADANVASGDLVSWSILDSGTGTVTGVSAVAASGGITFTFSADPQDDCIISYVVLRAAV